MQAINQFSPLGTRPKAVGSVPLPSREAPTGVRRPWPGSVRRLLGVAVMLISGATVW
jgi:hypothetical protein